MVELRSYVPDDVAGIEAVLLAAFGSPVASSDVVRMSSEPHHIHVAVENGRVIGTVASTRYGNAAYVGPMAVHPERQSVGIGSKLLSQLIVYLEGHGVRSMSLEATEAGVPLYEKHGFTKVDVTQTYARELASEAASRSEVQAPDIDSDETDIAVKSALLFDAVAYDYDRGSVFRQLAGMKPAPKILLSGSGYAFARTKVLGPWVATSPYEAETLLQRALLERPSIDHVLVPGRNVHAPRYLSDAGFEEIRSVAHMTRGPERMKRECVYGLISPAFG